MNEIDPQKMDYWVQRHGIKRYAFAKALGEHPTNYSQWLSGKRKIALKHYDTISNILKVPLDQLLQHKVVEVGNPLPLIDAVSLREYTPVAENIDDFLRRKQSGLVPFIGYCQGHFIVRVDASIASDEFPLDTLLLIDILEPPANGSKILARLSGGGVISARYSHDKFHGQIILSDLRRNYPQQIFNTSDNFFFWMFVVVSSLRDERPPHSMSTPATELMQDIKKQTV